MANEGVFITKQGVTLPTVSQMSSSNFAAYQNDLILPQIKDTDLIFNAFEGFKYRGYITDNVLARFLFDATGNYTPSFVLGSGSLNTANGEITPSSVPLQVEKANTVFLSGSTFSAQQLADGDDVGLRIASIDGLSHILHNIDTKALAFTKNGVPTDTDTGTYTEPEIITIEVTDTSIDFSDEAGVFYTLPRTFVAEVLTGGVGIFTSSGLALGDALPFDQTDTFEAANITGNGTLKVTSSFGQSTTYTVKLGAALVSLDATVEVPFVAGQAGSHSITDDYTGGIGTKSYALASGSLPGGMILTGGGTVQGIPTTDGTSTAFISVTDEYGTVINIEYSFVVEQSANVTYNPPAGIEGVPYNYNPNISGVDSVVLASGTIPTGLSLNAVTGELTGTPSANATFSFSLTITVDGSEEVVDVVIVIYNVMASEVFANGDSAGLVVDGGTAVVNQSDVVHIDVTQGSGFYQYSIDGGNSINSDGDITLFGGGEFTVTVTDIITGQSISFTLTVAGQGDICGSAVELEDDSNNDSAPCTDILTDCNNAVTVAFQGMHILKGVSSGQIVYRDYPLFETIEGAKIEQNGKPFVMFRSTSDGGFALANNAKDGKPFILQGVVDASVANSAFDMVIGGAKQFVAGDTFADSLTTIDWAIAFTTVGADRKVEIRKDGVYQPSSRFDILEGQEWGFAMFEDTVLLYIDGLVQFQTSSNSFSCSGLDIVFLAEKSGMIVGGRVGNLIYDIATAGSPDEVGTLNTQTGLYTPSINNIGLVKITGYSTINATVFYQANVRVIRGASLTSLERAMIEGRPVECYVAGLERKDDLPLRLTREGRPDRNQFFEPLHLGTLLGSGKFTATLTRNDFRNDRGATSSSTTIDKVVFNAVSLAVRDFEVVKRVVPFLKEQNSNGVRRLQQYSTGCQKHMRLLMVWENPDCEDVPVWDAIELVNAMSYTMFDLEVGQAVQSSLPVVIEGFPDKNGLLWEYSQFGKHFHRIGSST